MVQGLADAKIGWAIDIGLTLPDIRYCRHGWTLAEPYTQFCDSLGGSTGKNFDVTIVEIDRVTGDAQPYCFPSGTIPKPHALYAPTDPEATRY